MLRLIQSGDWPVGRVLSRWTSNTRQSVPEVESAIEQAWIGALARPGVNLFDGPMCRLESWQASDAELFLNLSPSSYKVFLGTNMSHPEFADRFGSGVMANPLGLSTPVITADHRLVLGFRNHAVAYYPGRVHPFAGSLEPSDTTVFTAILRELDEELSLSLDELVDLRCTGIAEDESLRQPELIFAAKTSLTESTIIARLDHAEHSALWSVPAFAADIQSAIADDARLTPVAVASLLLWGNLKFGQEWFKSAKMASQIQ